MYLLRIDIRIILSHFYCLNILFFHDVNNLLESISSLFYLLLEILFIKLQFYLPRNGIFLLNKVLNYNVFFVVFFCKTLYPQLYACPYKMQFERGVTLTKLIRFFQKLLGCSTHHLQ